MVSILTQRKEQKALEEAAENSPEPRRGIKSYVLRQGHLTPKRARAVRELYPVWGLPFSAQELSFQEIFSNANPVILDIGFGMGDATASAAAAHPEQNFLGVEVHTPGVGHLLSLIAEQELTNVRLIQHDVTLVLEHMIPDDALAAAHIYFPDPWPKKRHHKRRLIQAEFIRLLTDKLSSGGRIHLATDWEEYAYEMLAVLGREERLMNVYSDFAPEGFARPQTKFEARGKRLGHPVRDLIFQKK